MHGVAAVQESGGMCSTYKKHLNQFRQFHTIHREHQQSPVDTLPLRSPVCSSWISHLSIFQLLSFWMDQITYSALSYFTYTQKFIK